MIARSVVVASGSLIIALPFILFYVFRRRSSVGELSKVQREETVVEAKPAATTKPLVFKKEDLSLGAAEILNESLKSSDPEMRYQALMMIQQASAFTSNYSVLVESKCFESMLSLLDCDNLAKSTDRQNLCILQTLANMVCDMACLDIAKTHLNRVIRFAFILEYSDVVCAALQVLCNVALTATGCRMLDDKLPRLFAMLETTDPYILRQVLSVLVNLSCDTESCHLILTSEVSDSFVKRVSDCLAASTQPMVLLQLVTLLKNFYRTIISIEGDHIKSSDVPSTYDFLSNSKVALKVRVQFVLSEPSIIDTNNELVEQAQSLLDLLEKSTLPAR